MELNHVKWNLNNLYIAIDDPKISENIAKATKMSENFADKYKDRIGVSDLNGELLFSAIKEYENILKMAYKPDMYAALVFSADTSKPENGAFMQKIQEAVSAISIKLMFFDLEIMAISEDTLKNAFKEKKELELYAHHIKTVRAFNPYKLSEAEEKILEEKANSGRRAFDRLFDQVLSNAQFEIEIDGETKIVSESEVLTLLRDPNRNVRAAAAASLTKGLLNHSTVLTFIFNTLVYDKSVDDRLRNYSYPQESRNLSNELEKEVVDLLIKTCTENYGLVSKFYNLKKKILGVDKLTHIDRYAPIFKSHKEVEFDKGKEIVLESFSKFSDVFAKIANDFFEYSWIDAEPRAGKRGGAFCMSGIPEINPYIMMNYMNKQDDVMTLAHELGHGIHACLSAKQNLFDCTSTLPVAENASTFGEMLVFESLVEKANTEEKLALYAEKIEGVFATIFRQAAMYIFESRLHEARRTLGELSIEQISDIWQTSLQEMFGDSVELGEEHKYWWLYVSHFIGSPFYVYAYSFGELMVLSLYSLYKNEGKSFVEKYTDLLSQGGSKSPVKLLEDVGFDIRKPEFWKEGMAVVEKLISDFELIYENWNNSAN